MVVLNDDCSSLEGVGPVLSKKLKQCGIRKLQDLILHLPYRYQDRTRITPIQDIRTQDWCVIAGHISQVKVSFGKRMTLTCLIHDKTGMLRLRFFHFNKQQAEKLKTHPFARVFGEVRQYNHEFEMVHPEYQLLEDELCIPMEETLTPIYPAAVGLSQSRLRQLIHQALKRSTPYLQKLEWLSEQKISTYAFSSLSEALNTLHNPPPDIALISLEDGTHPALKRLAFDELVAKRLSMQFARLKWNQLTATPFPKPNLLLQQFINNLPFTLTVAQQRVFEEISTDLTSTQPMLRLLQGDVGAGKTVIAALCALQALGANHQVALMAPTELLSEQHAKTLKSWFEPLGLTVLQLSGKMKSSERKMVLQTLSENHAVIVVGTHALFQNQVEFKQLGLVIIDEQHRFGVEQRLMLQKKATHSNQVPHQLMMTATPIPRTLAMTQFAHLDLSIINELPPGRTPIVTTVMNQAKRPLIIQRLLELLRQKRQAYWVCTLIEESENLQCIAAIETTSILQQELPDIEVGLVHGRMNAKEKDDMMQRFKMGTIQLLVATTVIEVGVDVPNASIMIIENAERLGLSQLHQLRGRVGRGNVQSHCLLLYQAPLSKIASERLQLMRETTDGFLIAEKDLQHRGAGHFLGIQQTGFRPYKIANLPRDQNLLENVSQEAIQLLQQDPQFAHQLAQRWLGDFETFFQV